MQLELLFHIVRTVTIVHLHASHAVNASILFVVVVAGYLYLYYIMCQYNA